VKGTTTEKKIDELYDLIDDIDIAIMTTRRSDGRLVSRPMQTQDIDDAFDLWFVTSSETDKLDEIEADPSVNLAYYDSGSREWVSVSGTARLSRDRETIHRLYDPSWKLWFGEEDEVRDGGPDDPRLVLIDVDVDSVVYMKADVPRPLQLFEVAKGFITGKEPDIGEVKRMEGSELHGPG
jgi:general stress protein 26